MPLAGSDGKAACTGGVTVGVAEHIKAKDGQLGPGAHVEVENELILVEDSARFILILRQRGGRKHAGKQLMDAMRMDICSRERGSLCKLSFNQSPQTVRYKARANRDQFCM